MIAAISAEMGVDLVMIFKKSINITKFKIFIEELRSKYVFEDICIYMDNLSVHRSKAIKDLLEELSIPYIFSPIYSPDFNPIKSVFSIVK